MEIKVDNFTEIEKQLYEYLLSIWNDNDFIIGVLNALETDVERKEVVEFIESNENVTASEITLLSLDIDQSRDNIIMDNFFSDLEEIAKKLS